MKRKWPLIVSAIALVLTTAAPNCAPDPTATPEQCPQQTDNLAGFDSVSISSTGVDIHPGQTVAVDVSAKARLKDPAAQTALLVCGITFADTFLGIDPQNDPAIGAFVFGFDSNRRSYGSTIHLTCDQDGYVFGADVKSNDLKSSGRREVDVYVRPWPWKWNIATQVPGSNKIHVRCLGSDGKVPTGGGCNATRPGADLSAGCGNPCQFTSECDITCVCSDGRCVKGGRRCRTNHNEDCPAPGWTCRDNVCTPP